MSEYKIISITLMPQGCCLIKIALDISEKNILVLKIEESIISDIRDSQYGDSNVKESLQNILLKDNSLFLDKLIQKALNDNKVQGQLKQRQNGIFTVNYDIWIRLTNNIKEEQEKERLKRLENILLQNSLKI